VIADWILTQACNWQGLGKELDLSSLKIIEVFLIQSELVSSIWSASSPVNYATVSPYPEQRKSFWVVKIEHLFERKRQHRTAIRKPVSVL
jgi:hypothetical protein